MGVTGIDPNIQLYSARVLDKNRMAPISRVVEAIYWAIEKDVNIINISFGTSTDSAALKQAIQDAYSAGILIIAAGNNGNIEYPAAYDEVMAIGSVDSSGEISKGSATGEKLELVAPGEQIKSTAIFNGEIIKSGTSMAVPHVVGAAATLWQKDTSCSNNFIRQLLDISANLYGDSNEYGFGLVDINYALELYDEYKSIYKESMTNSIINNAKEKGLLNENKNSVITFNDVNYVEGSWYGDLSGTTGDHIGYVNNNIGSISSTNLSYIIAGCTYQDMVESGLKGMDANPQWHGYLWEKSTTNGDDSNFISSYLFLTQVAANNGSTSGITMGSTVFDSMSEQITSNGIKDNSWGEIFGLVRIGSTVTDAKKRYFTYGLAIHTATDVFAHSAWRYKEGLYQRITHEYNANPKYFDADNPDYYPKRVQAANQVASNIMTKAYYGFSGTVNDFALSSYYYDGTYYIGNIAKYAATQNGYQSVAYYYGLADLYTNISPSSINFK